MSGRHARPVPSSPLTAWWSQPGLRPVRRAALAALVLLAVVFGAVEMRAGRWNVVVCLVLSAVVWWEPTTPGGKSFLDHGWPQVLTAFAAMLLLPVTVDLVVSLLLDVSPADRLALALVLTPPFLTCAVLIARSGRRYSRLARAGVIRTAVHLAVRERYISILSPTWEEDRAAEHERVLAERDRLTAAWLAVDLPVRRRQRLIAAGVAPEQALDADVVALDDDDLETLAGMIRYSDGDADPFALVAGAYQSAR